METVKVNFNSKDFLSLQEADGVFNVKKLIVTNKLPENAFIQNNLKLKTLDNKYLYWKPYNYNSFSHYAEVIASYVANHFDLDSTKYFVAKWGKYKGTLSIDYKKENEKEISGNKFLKAYERECKTSKKYSQSNDLKYIFKALNYFSDTARKDHKYYINKKDVKEIKKNFLSMYMFNIAILNIDCHDKNWCLLFSDKKVRLGPTYDNSYSFHFQKTQRELLDWIKKYYSNPNKKNLTQMEQIFKRENSRASTQLNVLPEPLAVQGLGKNYLVSLREFKTHFPKSFNPLIEKFYSLSFTKIFSDIEKETKLKIPTVAKLIVQNTFETRYLETRKEFTKEEELNK